MLGTLVYDLLMILTAGLAAGLLCRWLRISVLIGYLLVGVLLGKGILGWVSDEGHELEYIAEAGVFLLLFSIGLEFSLDEFARLGRNLIVGGGVQMLLVALPIIGLLSVMGTDWQPAVLIASAASFSSTVLVFKALSEWGHSSLPHGRRAIGILLFQDAALIPLLLMVPMLTGTDKTVSPLSYVILALTSLLFVTAVVFMRRVLANWIIPVFAMYRSPDLVVLFVLVTLGATTLVAHTVGLPSAIGAFAAGLVFSGNRLTQQIDALVLPFRETFSAVFFVSLGLLLDPSGIWSKPLYTFACFVLLVGLKALAATIALRLTGLRWQASFGMGIGLAHVGEFAFVLVLLGWESGVLSESDYQQIVTLAIGSLILTPFLLKAGLRWTQTDLEEIESSHLKNLQRPSALHAVVIGAGPIGRRVASFLETAGSDVCLVDLSPINLHPFAQQGFRTVAGDATDSQILELADLENASIVIVSVPEDENAIQTVRKLRTINSSCFVIVRCRYKSNVSKLTAIGADRAVSEEGQVGVAILSMLNDFRMAGNNKPAAADKEEQ